MNMMSEILQVALAEVRLDKIPTEDDCASLTTEEKIELYEKQLHLIKLLRERQASHISELQKELSEALESQKSKSMDFVYKPISKEKKTSIQPSPKTQTPKKKKVAMSMSAGAFATIKDRQSKRKLFGIHELPKEEKRVRYSNLSDRPRFKNVG